MSAVAAPGIHPTRGVRRRLALALASVALLVMAPVTQAANATNINVNLPAAFSIGGTIRDNAGALLSGANVSVIGTVAGFGGYATTDATGKFKVIGLSPGQYRVFVSAPTAKNLVDGYYYGGNTSHFTTNSATANLVTVGPSKTLPDIKLPLGYTISGKVTTTGGAAIAGATVSVSGKSFDFATTSATGTYTLKGLAAGTYKMSITAPSASNYLSGYYYTGNTNKFTLAVASASGIVVGPNKSGVNVKLPGGYQISGTITSTGGTPLAGVVVQPTNATYFVRSVQTDATGKYTLKGLPAATYKLSLYPDPTTSYRDGYYTSSNTNHFSAGAGGASGITVGPNKTGINIKIPTGYSISGMVTTTGGAPIPYAYVSADNAGGSARSASTDATGKYTIRGLSGGNQILQIEPGFGDNLQSGFYTSANANHFTGVEASATAIVLGPNKTGINVKVPAGFTISGKIMLAGGVAASGASIYAYSADYAGFGYTNPDGTYTVDSLIAGTYKVQVRAPYQKNNQNGFYRTGVTGNFTTSEASATGVTVGP